MSETQKDQKDNLIRDNDIFERFESMQQKIKDYEDSNKILKRYKNTFKQSEEVKCKGCKNLYKSQLFKGHVVMC
jgi:cell fate (sporulation/competence/biofilm development) regulator YlbF (YheA/YmcA/DUF963 family)